MILGFTSNSVNIEIPGSNVRLFRFHVSLLGFPPPNFRFCSSIHGCEWRVGKFSSFSRKTLWGFEIAIWTLKLRFYIEITISTLKLWFITLKSRFITLKHRFYIEIAIGLHSFRRNIYSIKISLKQWIKAILELGHLRHKH